jgi:hypothetical protein
MHTRQLRRIIGYLQKLLYAVKRIRMSPTPTLNIYLFEGPIVIILKSFLISLKLYRVTLKCYSFPAALVLRAAGSGPAP